MDDQNPISPREDSEHKICIRENRTFKYPNELEFEFDNEDQTEYDNIKKEYFVFWIDCYQHGSTNFSLAGSWMQCRFDTSKDVGFIAVDKKIAWDKKTAESIAREEIQEYSAYCNGEVYYSYISEFEETTWSVYWYENLENLEGLAKEIIDYHLKDKKKYCVVVNVNLEFTTYAKNEEEAEENAENMELPGNYLEDSRQVEKVFLG